MKHLLMAFLAAGLAMTQAFADVCVLYYGDATGEASVVACEGEFVVSTLDRPETQNSLVVGLSNGEIRAATLARMDLEAGIGLYRIGPPVANGEMERVHALKAAALREMIPSMPEKHQTKSPSVASAAESAAEPTAEGWDISINETVVTGNPVSLPVRSRESEAVFEFVNRSTETLWQVEMRLSSDPKLGFMKKGASKGLNDVPMPELRYFHQSFFKPLRQGDSFSVPVEIFYIKRTDFDWTLTLSSKQGEHSVTIPVRFEKPKD